MLREALIRVRGELSAMGRDATISTASSPSPPEPDARQSEAGLLVVEVISNRVRIQAYGPYAATPIVQEFDLSRRDLTAEEVGVRTVEALRAALLGHPSEPSPTPERAVKQPDETLPKPARVPSVLAPKKRADPCSLAPRSGNGLSLLAAPAVYFEPSSGMTGLGAQGALLFGRSHFVAGVFAASSLVPGDIRDLVGKVDVGSRWGTARGGGTIALDGGIELWFLAGAGVAQYTIRGRAEPGYVGVSRTHTSPVVAAAVGGAGWFTPSFGAYLLLDTSAAIDSPSVHVAGRQIAELGRPSLWISAGIVLQAPRSQ
ncbi:MAG TPA: hypothetical protein VFQ61_39455 [Polyangiaceae bacterium]|nr:hypothetical protein [Polyangiaceae bacterium]